MLWNSRVQKGIWLVWRLFSCGDEVTGVFTQGISRECSATSTPNESCLSQLVCKRMFAWERHILCDLVIFIHSKLNLLPQEIGPILLNKQKKKKTSSLNILINTDPLLISYYKAVNIQRENFNRKHTSGMAI